MYLANVISTEMLASFYQVSLRAVRLFMSANTIKCKNKRSIENV